MLVRLTGNQKLAIDVNIKSVSLCWSSVLIFAFSCHPGFSFFPEVHESDTAGHGLENGEPRRKPWHEARHAAWHGRTGRCQKLVWLHLSENAFNVTAVTCHTFIND